MSLQVIRGDNVTITLDQVGQVFEILDDTGAIHFRYTAGDYFVEVGGSLRETGGAGITDL